MQRPLDLGERTVTDLSADWLVEHGTPPAVAKLTGVAYEKAVRTIIVPHLGELPVVAVRREHLVAMHIAEVDRPSASNLALVVARMIFAYAEEIGLRTPGSNPVVRIRKHPTRNRKRPLAVNETAAMLKVLERAPARGICTPALAAAFQLVLLTGARRDEIMQLRWCEVDEARRVLVLDRHKTVRTIGQKVVPLPRRALQLLQRWRASLESPPTGDAWVFEGSVPGKPICDPWRAWNRVRKAAGLDDVQMRDGRSGWATNAHDAGVDPVAIQNQLGHRSLATTGKYIRVTLERAREIADHMEAVLRTGKRKAVRS
jgi:integrase